MKEGWTYKKLGEVGTFYRGINFAKSDFVKDGFPCIHYGQIHTTFGPVTYEHLSCIPSEMVKADKLASKGNLIIAITSEDVEASCKCTAWLGDYDIAVGAHAAIYKHQLNPIFVSYFFKSPVFQKEKEQFVHGFKVMEIKPSDIAKIPIPILSEQEQQAIVSRLDSAFAQIDALKANAEKQLEEARKLFQAELSESMKPKEGWEEKTLKEIARIFSGYAFKSSQFQKNGKYQVVRIGNIKQNFLRLSDSAIFINELDKDVLIKSLLRIGDLVVTQTGTRHKRDYGYVAMVSKDNLVLNQRNACIRFDDINLAKFFLYFSYTDIYKDQFFADEGGTVGQGNVGLSAIKEMIIPYPSSETQQEIVSRLDALSANVKRLEELQQKTLAECDALKQAMLREVFE